MSSALKGLVFPYPWDFKVVPSPISISTNTIKGRHNGLRTSRPDHNEKNQSVAFPSTGKSMGQIMEFTKEAHTVGKPNATQ
jgi:hypothetical protein